MAYFELVRMWLINYTAEYADMRIIIIIMYADILHVATHRERVVMLQLYT